MELAFVIAADRGTMTDERTGEIRPWANIHYLTDYREDNEKGVGFKPIKAPCSSEAFEIIRKGKPGLYRLDFRTRPGAMGKPTLTLVAAELVRAVDIFADSTSVPLRPSAAPVKPAEKAA